MPKKKKFPTVKHILYIYIYRERERERERDMAATVRTAICSLHKSILKKQYTRE